MRYVGKSSDRFTHRIRIWRKKHRFAPTVRHHSWWLAHNCISHPLLGFRPSKNAIWFHDWTSKHLNQRTEMRPSPAPKIPSTRKWLVHNVFGHLAIGLLPIDISFRFHDYTAEHMDVPDWV